MASEKTPFDLWREQQAAPADSTLELNPGRRARFDLACHDIMDAHRDHGPDSPEFVDAFERAIALRGRLYAEQLAELGRVPDTLDGCIAVLNTAAQILELIGPARIQELTR